VGISSIAYFSHLLLLSSFYNLQCHQLSFAELALGKTDAYIPECGPVVKPTEMERKQTQMERFDTMETGSMIPPIVKLLFEAVKMAMSGSNTSFGLSRILVVGA
jgi:hypothetical protein